MDQNKYGLFGKHFYNLFWPHIFFLEESTFLRTKENLKRRSTAANLHSIGTIRMRTFNQTGVGRVAISNLGINKKNLMSGDKRVVTVRGHRWPVASMSNEKPCEVESVPKIPPRYEDCMVNAS